MIFAKYDEQRSFPEYVDMVFKDLVFSEDYDGKGLPIADHIELLYFIKDGYFPDFCEVPEYIIEEELPSISGRRLKKLCKKLFDEYGEKEKASKIHEAFELEMEEHEKSYPEHADEVENVAF